MSDQVVVRDKYAHVGVMLRRCQRMQQAADHARAVAGSQEQAAAIGVGDICVRDYRVDTRVRAEVVRIWAARTTIAGNRKWLRRTEILIEEAPKPERHLIEKSVDIHSHPGRFADIDADRSTSSASLRL